MKYTQLLAILGLSELNLKAGFFGGKAFVAMTEEQLDLIEEALKEKDTSAMETELKELREQDASHRVEMGNIENAVTAAMKLNSLEANSTSESIELLGTTCKAYGEKKTLHTLALHNGEESNLEQDVLIDGYLDPTDEHNKLLNSI